MIHFGIFGILTLMPAGAAEGPATHRLEDIHLRDPFILPVAQDGMYYLYGTGWRLPGGPGFMVYRSPDLATWEGPYAAFTAPEGFQSENYWAPEVHAYRGRYYMLATFKQRGEGTYRHTRILVADKPEGPFSLLTEGPATPAEWFCLDGTLFVDDAGDPWMVFCHEWVQVVDGEVCAVRLSEDLTKTIGEPLLLFRASEAPWGHSNTGTERKGGVTDGPFLHRTADGGLLMLWSSFGEGGYKLAVAHSQSGQIEGPWVQEPEPIFGDDGGHGMLFRRSDGQLMATLHQPNRGPLERPRLFEVKEEAGSLRLKPWSP